MNKNSASTRIQMLDKLAYKFIRKYSNKKNNFKVGDIVIFKKNKKTYQKLKENPELRIQPRYSVIQLEGLVTGVHDDIIMINWGVTDLHESEGLKDISNMAVMGYPASELEIVSNEEDRERNIRRYSLSEADNYLGDLERKYQNYYSSPDE